MHDNRNLYVYSTQTLQSIPIILLANEGIHTKTNRFFFYFKVNLELYTNVPSKQATIENNKKKSSNTPIKFIIYISSEKSIKCFMCVL